MWPALGLLIAILLALFAFGSLGAFLGRRFLTNSDGSENSNNEAAFFWIVGVLGMLLVVWLLKTAFVK
jgi:hypothetical protein